MRKSVNCSEFGSPALLITAFYEVHVSCSYIAILDCRDRSEDTRYGIFVKVTIVASLQLNFTLAHLVAFFAMISDNLWCKNKPKIKTVFTL